MTDKAEQGASEEKRPVGRPSKYSEAVQAQADRYIFEYHQQEDVIPSAAGLCVWLGISRPTLHEWDKIYPDFSNTLAAIRELQEKVALNKGLVGDFNATIVKLVLANHGYSDKSNVDHTTNGKELAAPAFGSLYGTKLEEDA